jgi:uncharacterized C2H2 Zn-finger protein
MVSYKCEKCGKMYSHKSEYVRHINRKNPCKSSQKQQEDELASDKIKIVDNDIKNNLCNIEIGEVVIIGGKFKCYYCKLTFDDLNLLERHCKLQCKCNKIYNNIYKFDKTKLGEHIF